MGTGETGHAGAYDGTGRFSWDRLSCCERLNLCSQTLIIQIDWIIPQRLRFLFYKLSDFTCCVFVLGTQSHHQALNFELLVKPSSERQGQPTHSPRGLWAH